MQIRSAWLQFRLGHTTYLAFGLQIVNFMLIAYALFIERLTNAIPFWLFVVLMAAVYMPVAIGLGRLHISKQYAVENKALLEKNPLWAKITLLQLKMIEGTATQEERTEIKQYLEAIATK